MIFTHSNKDGNLEISATHLDVVKLINSVLIEVRWQVKTLRAIEWDEEDYMEPVVRRPVGVREA